MPDANPSHRHLSLSLDKWAMGCLLLMVVSLMATGCATPAAPDHRRALSTTGGTGPEMMLRDEVRIWIGTPHRLGGMNRRGIDCSGLVVRLYEDLFDMQLPRTTSTLIGTGKQVKKKNLTAGDLVFFKPAGKYRHVGIYLGNGEFVHASSTYGVMISRMDNPFWCRCYLTSRRLL
jgi:cell wall-associated NlpC family hydrolase